MFRIIKTDGTELGLVEKPLYIRVTDSGSFAPTTEDKAVGIAYQSVAYNLFGHDEITDGETVIMSEVNSGDMLTRQNAIADELILSMLGA